MSARHGGLSNPSRPTLSSQQSSSVPSTPHQRPRRGFGSSSRSPSPRGLSGSHSPRSVFSETNGPSTNPLKGRPFCKYEKTPALSRRRMQYNIGDAPLDDAPSKLKKFLDPNEEKKLSGDMRELYDRLLPTEESEARRRLLVEKLERILHQEWPGNEFNVHVFGSSGNLLCTSDSDVDICIQTPMKELESMHDLAAALDKNGMENVSCIPAKVPIVKIWDPEFKLAADLNVNNTLALDNTRMIKTYIQIDERVRPLAMIIKHWTKQRILNDAGIGGTISSYAWICLILNFLQTRKPPILPSLHLRSHKPGTSSDITESGLDCSLDGLEGFGRANKSTIGELLFQFYRYYGYEFNYDTCVVSVRQGRVLTRQEKGWTTSSKDGQWRLCIEEPFNFSRNLGNSADSTAFRGIHLELRDAFTNIVNLRLDKLIEQYEYPVDDKQSQTFFKKAPVVPKPTLTAAPAPSGRKGSGSIRSNRHNNRGNHSGASSRRASAGSTYGRGNQPVYSPIPPIAHNNEFTQQVANNWAMLTQHASLLKQQMYGNNGPMLQNQAYQLAQAHAHSVAMGGSSGQRDNNPNSGNSHGQRMFAHNMSPDQMANGSQILPYMFGSAGPEHATPMSHSISQDGPRTNPSSPSLASSIPARRGLQRTSVSNGTATGSLRSQSQPARGLPPNMFLPFPIAYDPSTGIPYFTMPGADGMPTYHALDPQYGYMAAMQNAGYQHADNQQKEYLGYYVESNAAQQMPPPSSNMPLPRSSSHTDLAQRRDKNNRDLQPLNLNGNKKLSRSPSPLGHARNFSTPLRSAPLPAASNPRAGTSTVSQSVEHTQSPLSGASSSKANPPAATGLLIVNGSNFPLSPPENDRVRRDTSSAYPVTTPEESSRNYFDNMGTPYSDESSGHQHGMTFNSTEYSREVDTSGSQNGLYQKTPRMESSQVSSAIGSPLSPFPSYNEATMTPLAAQEEEVVTSPTRKHHSPWQPFPPTNGVSSKLGVQKDTKDVLKSPGSKSAPVLSPVIENRMPTPQMQRRIDMHQPPAVVNGNLINGVATNGNLPSRPSEPVPPTPAPSTNSTNQTSTAKVDTPKQQGPSSSNQSASAQTNSNQWQTTGTGKKRSGRKRSKSGPATRSAPEGQTRKVELIPQRMEDRKGG